MYLEIIAAILGILSILTIIAVAIADIRSMDRADWIVYANCGAITREQALEMLRRADSLDGR